jgi:hypothetical protein
MLKLWDKDSNENIFKIGLIECGIIDSTVSEVLEDTLYCKCSLNNFTEKHLKYFLDKDYIHKESNLHKDLLSHVFAFKLPEGTTKLFKEGKYSELVPDELKDFVYPPMNENGENIPSCVVNKKESYKKHFIKQLNKEFAGNSSLNVELKDIDSSWELDLPPVASNETL